MVQITSSVLLAALLAAPSLAAPITADYENLSARDPRIRTALRAVGKHITSNRVAAVADVAAAAGTITATTKSGLPATSRLWKISGGAVKVAAWALSGRELDELDLSERDLKLLDELIAREPTFRAIARKVKKVFTSGRVGAAADVAGAAATVTAASQQPQKREKFDDFELSARELEDLEELALREPTFRAIAKRVKISPPRGSALPPTLLVLALPSPPPGSKHENSLSSSPATTPLTSSINWI
ncbi:unnamed protein product [Cyclocybe aegerita]|uniref:Uncharacterized protein n=1 Tax=Cyclocybe aegerita TaxID=1973307 RepID=A0A8S0W0V4_CYCAE|nr:unnamed protein product [Cyclocybe aegerita]